ncbi:hypothetical protein ACOMHN_016835 [Nucella lapillus]
MFQLLQLPQLLRCTASHQPVFIRWKKKPPHWRDPADLSWAAPLLEKLKQREQSSGSDRDRPPAMLHMVRRVRSLGGRPYWEKNMIKSLGLDEVKKYEPVVHKNTPGVNRILEKVKHLVQIVPITFPHGLPSDESDFHHCVLHADGQLEVTKKLHPLEKCVTSGGEEGAEDEKKVWAMDEQTVERATRKVMEQFSLSREYFPAKYVYKYNQDGKEHRYAGNHNILGDRDWY